MEYLITETQAIHNLYGLENVIVTISWKKIDGDIITEGETEMPPPDPDNFTAFDDITIEMMQQWIINLNT